MRQIKTRAMALGLALAMGSQLVTSSTVQATVDRDTVIREAVMSNVDNLKYWHIKDEVEASTGINDVTNAEIDEAITYLTDTEGKTRISDQSFLLTMGMLDKRFDDILWPATHNSFANDEDGEPDYLSIKDVNKYNFQIANFGEVVSTENHTLSMREQLDRGIRCIDIDLGPKQTLTSITGDVLEMGEDILDAISVAEGFLQDATDFITGKSVTSQTKFIPGVDEAFETIGEGIEEGIDEIEGVIDDIEYIVDNPESLTVLAINEDWSDIDSYHRVAPFGTTSIDKVIGALKSFMNANPNDIVTLRVSDIYDSFADIKMADNNENAYKVFNLLLKKFDEAGLLDRTANYFGAGKAINAPYSEYLINEGETLAGNNTFEWPLLKKMILSNKRLIIVSPRMHRVQGSTGDAIKNTETLGFSEPSSGDDKPYKVSLARLKDNNIDKVIENPQRLIKIDAFGDDDMPAGDPNSSDQNNNGRRMYDLAKGFNDKLAEAGSDRVLNFFHVDYFLGNTQKGGNQVVDIVDASNRINFENLGYDWEDVLPIDRDLYWNYIGKVKNLGVNEFIQSATTTIDPNEFDGTEFIDGNVWTGTEDLNLKDEKLVVKLDKKVTVKRIFLNFFSYRNQVKTQIRVFQNGDWYNLGLRTIQQDYNKGWYAIDLGSGFGTDKVEIMFLTDDKLHFKEVALGGRELESDLLTTTFVPTDDTFVKWGSKSGNNYHNNQSNIANMEVYNGSENKATFLEFDVQEMEHPTKEIKRAYLSFKVNEVDSWVNLRLTEDRDADNWDETTLTGNKASKFDDNRFLKEYEIPSNGYVKIEVTDQLKDYLQSGDPDERMTYRIATKTGDWYTIRSSETSTTPKLEVLYKEVPVNYHSANISADGTTYVKWGSNSKYNYSSSDQLLIYKSKEDSKNSKASFMIFDLNPYLDKKIVSAYLEYKIVVGDHARINIREDIDATNWDETELNGNAAKRFDHYNEIAHHRWFDDTTNDSIDVTNLIQNFVGRGDADGMITFRFFGGKEGDPTCYIPDRTQNDAPKLVIEYAD